MSLLDCVARDAQLKQHSRTSRILITGLVSNVSSANAVQRCVSEFASRNSSGSYELDQQQISSNVLTGIMFIINNIAIEIIMECDTDSLISFVSHCNTQLALTGLATFKVLTCVECVPRVFTLFAVRSLRQNQSEEWNSPNVPFNVTSLPLPPHTPSPILSIAFSTLHALLALAGYIKSLPQHERMEFLLTSSSRHLMDRVCPVERIQGFAASEELMNLQEFVEAFDAPLQIQNPRDRVWPIEEHTTSFV